jgi:hypothetical protein
VQVSCGRPLLVQVTMPDAFRRFLGGAAQEFGEYGTVWYWSATAATASARCQAQVSTVINRINPAIIIVSRGVNAAK